MANPKIPEFKAEWKEGEEGRWGMAIDMDICTGCQACVAACSMENNVPFVGEELAGYGRGLHWIRVERLWEGEFPEVKATPFQPVMCQQCGSAPCEPVCPVFATVHSQAENLNIQVYNRCVGTRYCANNCPYVARVFNWKEFERPEPLPNQYNPNVTVRARGVMEKCTFCIQRIHKGEDQAKSEGREVMDGEVMPACAQACPADAIVFGRLDGPESKVSKLAKDNRSVRLLEELGTQPRVTYLEEAPMASSAKALSPMGGHVHEHIEHDHVAELRKEHLMLDPRPRGEMNAMVMELMMHTSWKYWVVTGLMALITAVCLFGAWGYSISEGMYVASVNRPMYWSYFLVHTVFWIGISHAGTFVSALLRVFKAEFRRPFTRAAELMTTFGLAQAGIHIFAHMGRVWLAYWMFPIPTQRQIWPNLHSPLMWDFLAINTYLLSSTMYLFLPLIPDLAMARDRSTGWRKNLYRILALGFRGTEAEWTHLRYALNIFAFAILPVMFSVHTIVSWDFAAAMRPGWSSTIFGPYFVIGALQSGVSAVAMVVITLRYTMKNMDYFVRPEHFDALGKLMLVISMAWAYFFFNDYMVQWYGGDKWTDALLHFHEAGPAGWIWFMMLITNIAIPWLVLWNKNWRRNPWIFFTVGLLANVGMWAERFIIVPVSLQINRMPFMWGKGINNFPSTFPYISIEIPIFIGSIAFFILLYMLAAKLIPLVPVWEVQEGQMAHSIRQYGKESVVSVADLE